MPIWIEFLSSALKDLPEVTREQPSGLVRVKIDRSTGQRLEPDQDGIFEYFKSENVPELPQDRKAGGARNQNPLPDDLL